LRPTAFAGPSCAIRSTVGAIGLRAANNLVNFLNGDPDYLQANRF
jgi:hypothetical protein